jgi:hypothetical protein
MEIHPEDAAQMPGGVLTQGEVDAVSGAKSWPGLVGRVTDLQGDRLVVGNPETDLWIPLDDLGSHIKGC